MVEVEKCGLRSFEQYVGTQIELLVDESDGVSDPAFRSEQLSSESPNPVAQRDSVEGVHPLTNQIGNHFRENCHFNHRTLSEWRESGYHISRSLPLDFKQLLGRLPSRD